MTSVFSRISSVVALVGLLFGVASSARAVPKSLFVQATSVPTGTDAYITRTWFNKVCTDHRTPGSPDFIHNLVLSEIADTNGNLMTAALDIIEDYYGCFDNVFVGTRNLPHADPYVTGMKDPTFRWDNINLSVLIANAYEARFNALAPASGYHWYVSYEANLNSFTVDTVLKNAYAAYLLELSNQFNAIRPAAVMWSPAFWTSYSSVPSYSALQNALNDVLTTAPGITWLHFQDFVGQASSYECDTTNTYYGFTSADGIGYHGLLAAANPGSVVSLRVNMEHFIFGEVATCGSWYMLPGDPVELAGREGDYQAAGVPIGASWEIRWWYQAHYGPEGQQCNQVEVCDGADNDCNLQTDEGLGPRSCAVTNGHGTCAGTETCGGAAGWVGCTAATPAAEVCDGVDNNCNGQVDEACTTPPDAGPVDAGTSDDGGVTTDAGSSDGATDDASTTDATPGDPGASGGCRCQQPGGGAPATLLLVLCVLLMVRRRAR